MANLSAYALTATAVKDCGPGASGTASSRIVRVILGAASSITPRGRLIGSSETADTTLTPLGYRNMTTNEDVSGEDPITASGIYKVYTDGCELFVDYTHGAASSIEFTGTIG